MPGFKSNLQVQELHDVSTDSISTGRYIPNLHAGKVEKITAKHAFGMVASLFNDYN